MLERPQRLLGCGTLRLPYRDRDDLWLVPASGGEAAVPYVNSTFNESQGVVSPDGKWMAYALDESGRFEIYIDSFPKPGTRARLTTGGGSDPRWRADGRELYVRRGSEVHVVSPFTEQGTPEAVLRQPIGR